MPGDRSLVLVAGSGRSGTSLFAGLLQRLGFYVPQPEVPADDTNPRGFAESQWVVDFHTALLRRARVQVSDARPAAWGQTADVGLDEEVQRALRAWLDAQFRIADHVVIKDPRLSWFLSLWRRAAEARGITPRFATMLRHPAAVVDSKRRWYGDWQGEVARTAGWVNQTLFTERATRDAARAFVRYDDLLDDWTKTIARVGDGLELTVVRDASVPGMRRAHEFVDRSLSRSTGDWESLRVPGPLRDRAEEVWGLMSALADGSGDGVAALDAARAAYIVLYEEAEAIAQSSIDASRRRPAAPAARLPGPLARAVRRVPRRYRQRVPLAWRQRIVRALGGR